ncbi:T-lymphoma invasion and metastasis-inducing protein 2 [Channa argus]|uniref:T-lymphoma invasion and metastasis-inducing protein 2 n=1 Tax=Channa argus TaxID=215402 RepID=A0A6G1QLX2_CHAAH|nr:T-lymphoma invasion and metastasis-inducing protein 2 [Channa argus]
MVKCAVSGCPNRTANDKRPGNRSSKRFFSFPQDPVRVKVWLAALRETDKQDLTEQSLICEDHFLTEDIATDGVKHDAIPIMPPYPDGPLGLTSPWGPESPEEEEEQWTTGDCEEDVEEEGGNDAPPTSQPPQQDPVGGVENPPETLKTRSVPPQVKQLIQPKEGISERLSTGQLTRRLLELLVAAPHGSLDVREAAMSLQTSRRRVHNIINVLEDIDLVQKESVVTIKWIGKSSISNFLWRSPQKLRRKLDNMKLVEDALDDLVESCAHQLFSMTDDLEKGCLQVHRVLCREPDHQVAPPFLRAQTQTWRDDEKPHEISCRYQQIAQGLVKHKAGALQTVGSLVEPNNKLTKLISSGLLRDKEAFLNGMLMNTERHFTLLHQLSDRKEAATMGTIVCLNQQLCNCRETADRTTSEQGPLNSFSGFGQQQKTNTDCGAVISGVICLNHCSERLWFACCEGSLQTVVEKAQREHKVFTANGLCDDSGVEKDAPGITVMLTQKMSEQQTFSKIFICVGLQQSSVEAPTMLTVKNLLVTVELREILLETGREASVNVVLHVGVSAEEEAAAKVTPNPTQEPHLSLGSPPVCLQYQDKDPSQPAPETDPHPHLPPNFRAAEDPCARMHSNKIETYMKKTVRGRRPEPHNVPYSLKTDDSHEMLQKHKISSNQKYIIVAMGNTDSHSSFSVPARPSCSLRVSSRRDEVPSARSWWRSNQGGCRNQAAGRNYLTQHATGPPYTSWHYEPKSSRGGSRLRAGSPPSYSGADCRSPFGYLESGGGSNRICGERASLQSRGSPKVLLSRDGSMRVEFTNSRVVPVEPQGLPSLPAVTSTTGPGGEASVRTSKGSSLSSDGSWYDSPWGAGAEPADSVFACGQSVDNSSGYTTYSSTRTEETAATNSNGYNTFFSAQAEDISPGFNSNLLFPAAETNEFTSTSSGRTEDSGIGDSVILHPDLRDFALISSSASSLDNFNTSHTALPGFPTAPDSSLQPPRTASSSSALLVDIIQEEEGSGGGVERCYSSLTLPCRRAESVSATLKNSRKDFLKSRIRQLTDWTGSLSRKKRRIQEPYSSDPGDVFISTLNSGLVDCSTLWSSNPLHSLSQDQVPSVHCGSSRSLNSSNDAQRQNIYENFMQELETGCSGAAERTEPSECDGEDEEEDEAEEEMDGEAEVGGEEEQLNVLLEKEQGVVRRAGWLSFKALITVSKDRKLELVGRRKWRHYWVTLKGCSLLFYETYGKNGSTEQELSPRYALLADDSIVQAVPEHPKREHVFCLSNSYGDVYLFQATNQTDLENWVTAIHSASASLLAKRQGREDTLRLLRCQSRSLLHNIDMDGKMKKMAELQLSVIKEQQNRKAVESQIQQWEQNLEKLNLDLFRLRCYLSSLQGSELPNPKSLLAVASRPSKSMLGRLGVFSVSSFHALVCSRGEVMLRRGCLSRSGGNNRRRGLPSSLKALDGHKRRCRDDGQCGSQMLDFVSKHREVAPSAGRAAGALQVCDELQVSDLCVFSLHICRPDAKDFGFAVTGHVDGVGKSHIYVSEVDPKGQSAREGLRAGDEILAVNGAAVSRMDLDLMQSLFSHQKLQLLLRRDESQGPEQPPALWLGPEDPTDPLQPLSPPDLQTWLTDSSACASVEAPVDVLPPVFDDVSTGTSEETELQGQPRLCEHGCSVLGAAARGGHGDTGGRGAGWCGGATRHGAGGATGGSARRGGVLPELPAAGRRPRTAGNSMQRWLRWRVNMEQVYSLYRTFPEGRAAEVDVPKNPYSRDLVLQPASPTHLSVCQRLRKVIQELVDTEKSYVKMEALFGSLPEMLDFQRVFLQTLEERIASCPNFRSLETPEQFKKLLFSLGGSFLYYADHFKLYSGFCANHIKVQKVLERAKTDAAFKHFLETRNPTNQHSSSLESYLIKPVQRVLKYPLLLRELVSLTDPESPEHAHLTEALRAMEKVASHINEMQKIYEDYGSVFDQLAAEQSEADKQVRKASHTRFSKRCVLNDQISVLLFDFTASSVSKLRGLFKRAVILVYRENGKLKKRMTGSRSADLNPFRFRWLIPVSAVQVRPATIPGSENTCVWELVHSRSEVEGRPETVFQLCSSGLETKAVILRALRSLLRERASVGSLRRTRLSTAERSSSWRRRQQQRCGSDGQRTTRRPPEESCRPEGAFRGETCSEPLLLSHAAAAEPEERRTRLCSLTSELEAQLQRLNFTEDEAERGATSPDDKWRQSSRGEVPELEKDFSVQSFASVVNEDCFYDSVLGKQKTVPTLQG